MVYGAKHSCSRPGMCPNYTRDWNPERTGGVRSVLVRVGTSSVTVTEEDLIHFSKLGHKLWF